MIGGAARWRVAQAYCSDAAVGTDEECVQMDGGIGFTWERPAHPYLKRAKGDALALGTPTGTAPRSRNRLAFPRPMRIKQLPLNRPRV